MRGLIHGLGAVLALAIVAPAFAGDLTSIELDPSGKIAIAVKKDSAKLAPIPDIGGIPNKGFTYGAVYQVAPNSIDIGKGINVMRGHVDAKGSIAVHEGPKPGIRSLRHQRHRQDDPERQGWQTVRRHHLQAR